MLREAFPNPTGLDGQYAQRMLVRCSHWVAHHQLREAQLGISSAQRACTAPCCQSGAPLGQGQVTSPTLLYTARKTKAQVSTASGAARPMVMPRASLKHCQNFPLLLVAGDL